VTVTDAILVSAQTRRSDTGAVADAVTKPAAIVGGRPSLAGSDVIIQLPV